MNMNCKDCSLIKTMRGLYYTFCIIVAGILFTYCAGKESSTAGKSENPGKDMVVNSGSGIGIDLISPDRNALYTPGEKIEFRYRFTDKEEVLDSVIYYFEGRKIGISYKDERNFIWKSDNLNPGHNTFMVRFFSQNGRKEAKSFSLKFKSDIKPAIYSYRVIKSYPHASDAYTQGLVYYDGWLYEGTGKRGRSSLRKIELSSGEIYGTLNLDSKFFGEGICVFKDNIIQLTWTSKTGFVYDIKNFTLIKKINYPTQGWGLTADGKNLIMSDGSEKIYFLEPDYFTRQKVIEVYDDEGPLRNLNELEYINGEIWANVYQTDRIVKIDPATGKILAWIDLSGLLKAKDQHRNIDVMNGIAYDEVNERVLVTGKMWPKLFHIELVPIQQ